MYMRAEHLNSWQPDRLSQPEELRFTYEEEGSPEDFFVPYIWSLVVSRTTIPWNVHAIALFQPVLSDGPEVHVPVAPQQLQPAVGRTDGLNKHIDLHASGV